MKTVTFLSCVEEYIRKVQEKSDEEFRTYYPVLWETGKAPKFETTAGARFIKVIRVDSQRSVFCFIERNTGDIYKPATWAAPAKDPRGNIFDENAPLTSKSLYK